MLRTGLILAASALVLAACATTQEDTPPRHEDPPVRPTQPIQPVQPARPPQPAQPAQPTQPTTVEPTMVLTEAAFADLPGWSEAGSAEALEAFRRHCGIWSRRGSYAATYAGRSLDFRAACDATAAFGPEAARAFFEANFTPFRIDSTGGQAKLTAYYLPRIEVRPAPEPGFTEALRSRPADMVTLDLDAFEQRLGAGWAASGPASIAARLENGRVVPYPDRAGISREDRPGFAYAHPADVYNIQVQGSGRIRYPDGREACASFQAQNGYRWNSALGAIVRAGLLPRNPGGTWASLKQFWTENPDRVRADLNVDPSYVFFEQSASEDACPRGASGALLVGGGSVAIDPKFHAYGTPLYLFSEATSLLPRVLIAQDTGGAIRRGPLRGDFYVGEGPEAGATAERTSVDDPRFWALLPKGPQPPQP
jgi:membrane-bound lytic murein transglycosylase A